jgi:hypothetical protein
MQDGLLRKRAVVPEAHQIGPETAVSLLRITAYKICYVKLTYLGMWRTKLVALLSSF